MLPIFQATKGRQLEAENNARIKKELEWAAKSAAAAVSNMILVDGSLTDQPALGAALSPLESRSRADRCSGSAWVDFRTTIQGRPGLFLPQRDGRIDPRRAPGGHGRRGDGHREQN
jgi:hypothetical protein